ncbi:hypothetical protein J7E87_07185 [Streptomyces sp. ISL-1]|uniref:hypothetical protein n=1 Tax=Streptomyces sp. ISL-1 TaxID=2817657 RepID=UPI001BE8C352|nr:hypothetical protein [Streptomyces sp. ISL-1]MBT2389214.1 hypothetical protein [Streptomyces sp. ISL-1]
MAVPTVCASTSWETHTSAEAKKFRDATGEWRAQRDGRYIAPVDRVVWRTHDGALPSDYMTGVWSGPNRAWLIRGTNASGLDLVRR